MAANKGGRPKKPTSLKVLEGNPGKRKINMNEIKPEPKAPKCPIWLSKYAKEEWAALSEILEKLGLLTNLDGAAFAGYCQSFGRWRQAEEKLDAMDEWLTETSSGSKQMNPYVATAQKNLSLMSMYLGKFGMSPSDRAGLVVNPSEDEGSEMEKLLKKAK